MSSDPPTTRDRILDGAIGLLEHKGEKPVRMSDIAKAAGLSRQAVYLNFPNRADLLIAAVRHLDDKQNVDGRVAASRAATSGEERLSLWVRAWGDYIPVIHGVSRALVAMAATDPDARAAWADRMDAVRHGCAAAVAALARDGRLAPDLDETVATDLLFTILSVHGWEVLRLERGWSQAAYLDQMERLARACLLAA
ncbi:MAG: TetR/AcrR family transcriptional regulator [Pseudomonadota bacterium]